MKILDVETLKRVYADIRGLSPEKKTVFAEQCMDHIADALKHSLGKEDAYYKARCVFLYFAWQSIIDYGKFDMPTYNFLKQFFKVNDYNTVYKTLKDIYKEFDDLSEQFVTYSVDEDYRTAIVFGYLVVVSVRENNGLSYDDRDTVYNIYRA